MSPKRFVKQALAAIGVIIVTATTTSISPALAARYGIDFDRYCKSQYQGNGMAAWTRLDGNTVYDWYCDQRQPDGKVNRFGINVGHACAVQRNTWSHGFSNRNNPYSWYCER
jgi:hypothetical protein